MPRCSAFVAGLSLLTLPAVAHAQLLQDQVSAVTVAVSPLPGDEFATFGGGASRDQILKSGGANLADALADTPGVSGTGFSAGSSRPVVRGMDAYRVAVVENGLSSADVSDIGPDHGVPIDPLIVQRVEVVRGAAALRYGGAAIGGVVDAIDERIPQALPDQAVSGEFAGAYDSVDDGKEGSVLLDGRVGQFAWHLDGSDRRTGDYDTPLGSQGNSYDRSDAYAGGGSYFLANGGHIGLSVQHNDENYGIPSDTTHIDMRQTKIVEGSRFLFSGGPIQSLTLDGSYAQYGHDEVEPDGSIDSTFKNRQYDGRAELLIGPTGPLSASALGVQVSRRAFSALGDDGSYLFPTLTQSGAAFAFTRAPLGQSLNLEAAVRAERVKVDGTPASGVSTSRDFTPLSGSLGVNWTPLTPLKLSLTASSTARAPAQAELFARGGHDGPDTFETGDPNLKIERGNSLEADAVWSAGAVKIDGAVWASRFDHYIYGQLTGRTCDDAGVCTAGPGGDLRELNYLQTGAHFQGAELKVAAPIHGGLSLNLLADSTHASLTSGGPVPRIPPWRAGGGLSWTSSAFDADFLWLNVAAQDRPGAGDTPTKGYQSLDADLAWRPTDKLEFDLSGHNLLNATERNAAALNKDLVVGEGRDVRLVARAKF